MDIVSKQFRYQGWGWNGSIFYSIQDSYLAPIKFTLNVCLHYELITVVDCHLLLQSEWPVEWFQVISFELLKINMIEYNYCLG